jgi:hypothetical protein
MMLLGGCSRPSIEKEQSPEPKTIASDDHETLWCRGGGKASAETRLEVQSKRTRATSIGTTFEFAKSAKPAGARGGALEPGTCAYADRTYARDPISLTYAGPVEARITWRTTADGSSPPTLSVPADGVRSDKWLMKAQLSTGDYIASYEIFNR